ncbi:hypothetical protein J2S49_000158 [Arcanobacterium wilhelmae]|uniref:Restriction endonuclease n=1 Tax=Arcanobacterium wilhelmae TaxID=1803177 RepID=A0ABT9N8P5_9ACTO|nr:hypothetical protein [Arcanobacterium wilhelmae]MDP9800082.1 hypothetical protein [Arcanobacterium wilhelmae]
MTEQGIIARELDIAAKVLEDLAGADVDAIDIKSVEREEAPFLAKIVSKLSPMVGNLMEQRIASILNQGSSEGFSWKRQDPGFPDAVLIDEQTVEAVAGYEIKAWFVLSTEITGRFRESLNLLRGKNVNVVIVAWCLSNMVFGQPKVLGTLVVSGEELAQSRDSHYHNPPYYLTIEPNDTTARTANLQQSNVNGYRLQEDRSDPISVKRARERSYIAADPHTPEKQEEAQQLMAELGYRLDTNFAKIDRVENQDVEDFKTEILDQEYLGRTFRKWKTVFADLSSKNDGKRANAEKTIERLYGLMATEEPKATGSRETEGAH